MNQHRRLLMGVGILVLLSIIASCAQPSPTVAPAQPTAAAPTAAPPTEVPPTEVPPTEAPPTATAVPTPEPTAEPKVLRIAHSIDLSTFDPATEFGDTNVIHSYAVADTLLDLDPQTLDVVPRLAVAWEVNEDASEYTFTLRQGVKFHTGNTLTAQDVKFSLERLKNLQGNPAFFMDGVESIEAVDDYTVKIVLAGPDSTFLSKLTTAGTQIYDSQVCQENGCVADVTAVDADTSDEWWLDHEIGTGPYTVESWVRNQELRYRAFPDYWGETPHFDEIIIRDVKDPTTQRQLLERGDVDLALDLDPDMAADLEGTQGVQVIVLPAFNMIFLAVTSYPEVNEVLANPLVHQAIQLAIDYEGISEHIGRGAQRPAVAIPLGFPGADQITPIQQDVEKAKQLMAEAGYPDGATVDVKYETGPVYSIDMDTL
jgi:peptide/nickel transport system substrate-binding protein